MGGRAGWIWDKNARNWWLCELIRRCDAVILCRREDHSEVAMIADSQGSWELTRVGFEFILRWRSVSYSGSLRILFRTGCSK